MSFHISEELKERVEEWFVNRGSKKEDHLKGSFWQDIFADQ